MTATLLVGLVLLPGSAHAATFVDTFAEQATGQFSFSGAGCGSTASQSILLPVGATEVTGTAPPVGETLHTTSALPVASVQTIIIKGPTTDPALTRVSVTWTVVGFQDACDHPTDYPTGWTTGGYDLTVKYRISRTALTRPSAVAAGSKICKKFTKRIGGLLSKKNAKSFAAAKSAATLTDQMAAAITKINEPFKDRNLLARAADQLWAAEDSLRKAIRPLRKGDLKTGGKHLSKARAAFGQAKQLLKKYGVTGC